MVPAGTKGTKVIFMTSDLLNQLGRTVLFTMRCKSPAILWLFVYRRAK